MKMICPLCGKEFIFSDMIISALSRGEVFIKNPKIEIVCARCGWLRVIALNKKPR